MPITGKPESVEISFGMVFRPINRLTGEEIETRMDVVIDVGKANDNTFHVARIFQDGDTRSIKLNVAGTADLKDVSRVIDQMTCEEVIEAAKRGARKLGYELSEERVFRFQELARQDSRKLLLDR